MRTARNLRLSLRALTAHRARTGLALAGTATGVAGVLLLSAVAAGARSAVLQRLDALGADALLVTAERRTERAGRIIQDNDRVRTLTVPDARAILASTAAVVRAAPAQERELRAKHGPISTTATVTGTTPDWQHIRRFTLERGRFFTDVEDELRARVAVIGADVAAALFADSLDPVGREIRLRRVPFTVIGVLAPKGMSVDGNATEDDRIIIPLHTALQRVFAVDYLKQIHLELAPGTDGSRAERDVADILRARHAAAAAGEDFTIQRQRQAVEATFATQSTFARMGRALSLLSLAVGGSGILSIMLLSVRERRAEIGLRLAVGARSTDILTQFLAEALLLAAAGGLLGIVLGTAAAVLVSAATTWDAVISAGTLGTAVAVSVAIGVGFGGFPAWRAATLDPIDALRSA